MTITRRSLLAGAMTAPLILPLPPALAAPVPGEARFLRALDRGGFTAARRPRGRAELLALYRAAPPKARPYAVYYAELPPHGKRQFEAWLDASAAAKARPTAAIA